MKEIQTPQIHAANLVTNRGNTSHGTESIRTEKMIGWYDFISFPAMCIPNFMHCWLCRQNVPIDIY